MQNNINLNNLENETNQNLNLKEKKETQEIEKTEENKSFFEKLLDDFKKSIKENYKILILISIIGLLIIYINIPKELYNNKTKNILCGGDMKTNMMKSSATSPTLAKSVGSTGTSNGGKVNEGGKKKSISLNPISGGVDVMMWLVKNILLFYLFLLFITLIPSVPIILYITVFYFIMTGLVGKINSV